MIRILLIDDNPHDRQLATRELEKHFNSDLTITEVGLQTEFVEALAAGRFDVTITDYQLRWSDGLTVLRTVKDRYPDRPVIMFTNSGSQEVAVEAMKLGLDDYVIKSPSHYIRLPVATQVALEGAIAKRKAAGLEVRLQTLLNQLEVGIYRMTDSGTLLEANPAFFRVLGLEAIATPLNEAALSSHFAKSAQSNLLNLLRQNGPVQNQEVQLSKADGTLIWVRLHQSTTRTGDLILIDGLVEDISDRKQAELEREIFLSREKTARREAEIAQQRSDLVAEASRLLGESLDHRTTLPQLAQLTIPALADWCFIDIVENHIRNFSDPIIAAADPRKAELILKLRRCYPPPIDADFGSPKVLRTGQPEFAPHIPPQVVSAIAQDEEHLRLLQGLQATSYIIVPLIARGQAIGTMALALSRSDRHYTPADLTLAQELASRAALAIDNARLYQEAHDANQMKDEFLAIVSHELRTPLNSILGWSRMLQTRQLDEVTITRAIATIERNARAQTKLIDDILDISRIIRGKLRLNQETVHLLPIITVALDDIRATAELKNLHIETSLDADVGLVLGDAERLQQIVWNLLSNAVKFTPNGGWISVSLEKISCVAVNSPMKSQPLPSAGLPPQSDTPYYAQLCVRDTGQGISSDFLPFIFDRFRQADSTNTRSHSGLGLGLAIVRSLVEMHHGSVFAESAGVDQGAAFTVQLPIHNIQSVMPSLPYMTNDFPDLSGLRVLLVDDDTDTRELVNFVLQQCQAIVKEAVSAQEGFVAIAQSPFDLLISDISMPEEDGYSFMRRLRAYEAEQGRPQIPAIALTAFAREEDQQAALEVGFQQYLAKPINPFDLVAIIAALVKTPETAQ